MMQLIILKTNISTKRALKTIAPCFNYHPEIIDWSIDWQESDHVLRIESTSDLSEQETLRYIELMGYKGEVMLD